MAGPTGWAGAGLALGVAGQADMTLVAGVTRKGAGRSLNEILGEGAPNTPLFATAEEALQIGCDVFVEYAHPSVAKSNVMQALRAGSHVVIGTSGLTDEDMADIDVVARQEGKGVLAVGNFGMATVLLLKLAETAARFIPNWEIFDYAGATKPDSPSGTARELAARLGQVRKQELAVPLDETIGLREARGATLGGAQVHSVRLPGYSLGVEVVFGQADERLSIRMDSGNSTQLYVDGALTAIREVGTLVGVHRGLDKVLDL